MKEMADKHLKTVELYERMLENVLPDDKKKKPSSKEKYAKRTEAELSKSDDKPDGEPAGTTDPGSFDHLMQHDAVAAHAMALNEMKEHGTDGDDLTF